MLHLRYYPNEDADSIVLRKVHVISGQDADGEPIERSVVDADFKIAVDGVQVVALSLGNGIVWNDTTKTLTLTLTNGDLSDIIASVDGDFQYYITIENGRIITLFAGRTFMERSL